MTIPANDSARVECAYLVSSPWRSSGKTVLSIGMAATLKQRGIAVQTFKKGPDFIDPLWLAAASGRPCYNLDFHQQTQDEIRQTYRVHADSSTCQLIEGTMGLHDGIAIDGSDSNAAVARLLDIPVVLVMDCRGMHRSVAALVQGIQSFDPTLRFGGLVLNRVRTARHCAKIEQAINHYTDIKLLGSMPDTASLVIQERELGLTPAPDSSGHESHVQEIGNLIAKHIDIDALLPVAAVKPQLKKTSAKRSIDTSDSVCRSITAPIRIGIAQDAAFHFYYADDMDYFAAQGVELVPCSPLAGTLPKNLDGLWIGGGFPERHVQALSENESFRTDLKQRIRAGLAVHAECAGLMYLCNSLNINNQSWPMVGVINAEVSLSERPLGRGYMELAAIGNESHRMHAHEFHHSQLHFSEAPEFLYKVTRGYGVDGKYDGIRCHNVIASYAHFRHTTRTPWIDAFLARVSKRTDAVSNYV